MRRWFYEGGVAPFVGQIIGNLVLASAPAGGHVAYSPVNNYLYLHYGSTIAVCDISGTPSVVTTVAAAANISSIAYLPIRNKVLVLQASHKYQLLDCTNQSIASVVTMTNQMTAAPNICSSFSVDQTDDSVYLAVTYQFGKLNPATGAIISKTGFDSPNYLDHLSSPADIAFNNADGYLYVANTEAGFMLQVIDPAAWNSNPVKHNFGATPTNITATCKLVINRSTGHVYANAIGASKLFVMTDYQTMSTITTASETERGDYDTALAQVFMAESGSPGFVSVYNSSDALLTHTSIGSGVSPNPVAVYCAPGVGRYAVQKTVGGETLQIIAR